MRAALDEARRAADAGEVPVGAVVVVDDHAVAAAGNACIGENDPSAHAEIVAIRRAGAAIGNYRLTGTTLYATLEPCIMCAGAIVNARIERVVYGCADPEAGGAGSVVNILQTPFLNHRCDIVAGVLELPCRELLTAFFDARRGVR
jgi:tRNA(adenine34) deaminase